MSGQRDEALRTLDQLNEFSRKKYVSSFYKALIYIGLGNKDQAFENLNKAFDERESWMTALKASPMMDTLRSDPRCEALLRKMGLEK
jgi:tetratricopeptide (TPR) repeat protein